MGIDIGSTTVKLAVVDAGGVVFSEYRRHHSDIRGTLLTLAGEAAAWLGDFSFSGMITGSGGMTLAGWVGLPFVQEVVAVADAIRENAPATDVAIEIGGEDAKIIYFGNTIEQRMNGICAGGTGSFIDQMATLLDTDAAGLDRLAEKFSVIYPIAARCGVFAKSDLQPLVNEGTAREDLAASIFHAIVAQIISGLACGKPIRGNIAFLGGPLHFLPQLRARFTDVLKLQPDNIIVPENAHLFAAIGAAGRAETEGTEMSINTLTRNLLQETVLPFEIARLPALFSGETDYAKFRERHAQHTVEKADIATYHGDCFFGLDAGSTTTKAVLIGSNAQILWQFYESNEGNPLAVARGALAQAYAQLPPTARIAYSCVTGYGEALLQAALSIDMGEIETVAHYRAAAHFNPKVDFILDIGGQDMKCLRVKNGIIDTVLLNEACSAGCGSFLETFARSLDLPMPDFVRDSLYAANPVDLGSRCTVFMNSRVKQAQKEGAAVGDISAGLAYSVVKNALQKVIKITDPQQMGKHIVVQGGTFYNDAVLRAFELVARREATRPDISGLMGAFGAALLARSRNKGRLQTTLISKENLANFQVDTSSRRCKACENNCLLTINKFSGALPPNPHKGASSLDPNFWGAGGLLPAAGCGGAQPPQEKTFISGNRCEKAFENAKPNSLPNLYAQKYQRVFGYESLPLDDAPRGVVGIPRVMNIYENYPLWHTFFTRLGYRVVLSPRSGRRVYELGIESIPSESECYPAKLAHGHVVALVNAGVKYIFYPSVPYERETVAGADTHYNCPIVTSYPENIKNNVEEISGVRFHAPWFNLAHEKSLIDGLVREFSHIPAEEVRAAAAAALAEQQQYTRDVQQMGEEAVRYIEEHNLSAVVLAGRPYHIDPEINHGIPELITGYGIPVLSEDAVAHMGETLRPLGVRDQWAYHSRLYGAAFWVRGRTDCEMIQLNSFGCGLDAVTADEIQEILEAAGKIFTLLKIDEVTSLGSARIRIRSLFAALSERRERGILSRKPADRPPRAVFTKEMRATHTILCPQMAPYHFEFLEAAMQSEGYNIVTLPAMDRGAIDLGLQYVNNDACYPALIVVGQLLGALFSGKYDLANVSVMMSQTGGGCRASNYIAFIRKALAKAGMAHIPVISLSAGGYEKNPGMKLSVRLISKVLQSLIYGDLLTKVLYATRPYEATPGSADALYKKWERNCKESVATGKRGTFKRNCQNIVADFDALPLTNTKKPKVGVVGEILVKYHPTANNDIVAVLEGEGAEAVVPDLTDFFLYGMYSKNFNEKYIGGSKKARIAGNFVIKFVEMYRAHMRRALEGSSRFQPHVPIAQLAQLAEPIVSIGNQTGEGWLLTAEMVELIHSGVAGIVCAQPFACLPNHVTGKGIIKALHEKFPRANIVAVDYDPGASEVNQLNRIKLMLSAAAQKPAQPQMQHYT
jgi:predicted CoA-substrate-specific enzyme activase